VQKRQIFTQKSLKTGHFVQKLLGFNQDSGANPPTLQEAG
jgi:hypothetical protein